FRKFFDTIAKLGMGVLSHCGWLWPQPGRDFASYYSHPGRFEKVIRMHPETPFILAHMGGIAGFLETVMLTTRTPNTYVDCSPGQGLNVLEFAPRIAGSIPVGKLLWGRDGAAYDKATFERYRKALVGAGFGPHLREVFYTNARDLFTKLGALKPPKKTARRKRTRK
ncbi:MAG TPA: amidohydrolase family protein, partial [Planctomycetota bacterium]|nr:amidohydrolase family protein [Planctomycetota bacterium]